MLAITAPTGNIGAALTAMLVQSEVPARLLARDPARVGPFAAPLEVVRADLDEPAGLGRALDGVATLFLLSPGPDTPGQDAGAIGAAVRAGVERVVLLSSLGVERDGIGGGLAHGPGEVALRASGLRWTILRPSEFMTNVLRWVPEARTGTVSLPTGDGRVGFVAPADLAAVALAVSRREDLDDTILRPTGPEALTTAQAAAALGRRLGREVVHRDVPDAGFRRAAADAGMPPELVDLLATYHAGVARDAMELVTDDVETLTGRPATSLEAWLAGAPGLAA